MNRSTRTNYHDPKLCVDYLCGLCPYELLHESTGGICPKEHNPLLKTLYQSDVKADASKSLENEHLRSLSHFVKRRDQSSSGWNHRIHNIPPTTPEIKDLQQKVDETTVEWMLLMDTVEQLGGGTADKINISALMVDIQKKDEERQKFKSNLDAAIKETEHVIPKVKLCETCGTFVPSEMRPDHANSKVSYFYTIALFFNSKQRNTKRTSGVKQCLFIFSRYTLHIPRYEIPSPISIKKRIIAELINIFHEIDLSYIYPNIYIPCPTISQLFYTAGIGFVTSG
ncbi:hypothetical protein BDA99DRAFT_21802 [Phascolomyces articulosus]|uniref:Uncharacterized protein n=1 Tax=Phascolomyces articulosus TaxID=60185 RepID=A0AAD5KGK1_9FUNG|nr:hypothetical protein BDA99DRAFT_21802 [Phascolomyces articulosus]